MQKAFLITQNTDIGQDFHKYGRLYIGDSYCEHNMFYFLDNEKFISAIMQKEKHLTLSTPIISEKGLVKLTLFLKNHHTIIDEIVINDLGVLNLIKNNFSNITIIWGNFISGQNKDPYLKEFIDKNTHTQLSIDSLYYKKLFAQKNIAHIELYNTFQGTQIKQPFKTHLYYPYVIYSINRYCITALIDQDRDYMTVIESCNGCKEIENKDLDMELKIGGDNVKNYFRGNKQFYKNTLLPTNLDTCERIIYNTDLL